MVRACTAGCGDEGKTMNRLSQQPGTNVHDKSVSGYTHRDFEPVKTVFRSVVRARRGAGAALSIYVGDECVVDLWGGSYRSDSLQLLFSATKGALAVCANMLVQRGQLDLDAPVASVWPEFAAGGKDRVLIRWLLTHQAGVPAVSSQLPVIEYAAGRRATEELAAQTPFWEPGKAHGYHGLTIGPLVDEVVRRSTGRSIAQFFASEVAAPLGLEFWIGLPEDLEARVIPVQMGDRSGTEVLAAAATARQDPSSVVSKANIVINPTDFDTREVHAVELPAANGISTARALARMYAACMNDVDGVRLLDDATLSAACEVQAAGLDLITVEENRFGLGFYLPFARIPFAGPTSFGHDGAGGALGFGDRESGLAFGYITSLVPPLLGSDPATDELISAACDCL